ncbi:glycerol ethanol, ferric requiring protein [Marasmius sp. AFHP31]|nr:glycerol ethanol, ferric requiring protein [Marasmius sp. AFHP31]
MPRNDLDEDELEQIRRYEDFTTIDWIEDSIYERNRRIRNARQTGISGDFHLHDTRKRGFLNTLSWLGWQLKRAFESGQTWIVVSLVGICIGVDAALISIVTEWLSDIKMGYCSDGWWLNQQFCCWEIEGEETDACASWHPWSTVTPARYVIYVLFATFFSFTAAHLVRSLAKYAAGSGISEIKCILAGFKMQGFLGFSTFCIKSITLPLVIASGLSVGKEGPSVHLACCVGFMVAGLFKKFSRSQGKMREIITAASAAGVAVAFGSPVGGVLFSIEEMSSNFSIKTMWRSFFCALIATFTLSAMNPFRTGKLVLFQVTYDRDWHFFEIIFFIILGIFGGLYGAFVVRFNLQVAAFRRKHLANHGVAEAVILATLTAIIGYFNRFLRIDMTESMAVLFRECDNAMTDICETSVQWGIANSLFLATIIRMGLVVISYGCKVPAGIFVPSMAIGASFGRMVGIIVKAMYRAYPQSGIFAYCAPDVPCITPGTYAFLGAAAALSGVMRITVTVVVIMFELTGALTYILPTMIVLLVTKAVGDMLGTTGIADAMIRFNGFPFLESEDHAYNVSGKNSNLLGSQEILRKQFFLPIVSAVMRTEMQTLPDTGLRVKDVEEIMSDTNVRCFPIVSSDNTQTLLGYIGRTEVLYVIERSKGVNPETPCTFSAADPDRDQENLAAGIEDDGADAMLGSTSMGDHELNFWPWVNQTPMTVSPHLPLEVVMQLFKRMG